MNRLLIANRGEIAVRIIATAQDLGITCISVYPEDDALAQHVRLADDRYCLPGAGASAYLDIAALIAAAIATQADAIHPGYGFLSERHDFAAACDAAGITFVGPTAEQLEQFGNKAGARALAKAHQVPLIAGTNGDTTLAEAADFRKTLGDEPMLIKAVHGGGGRGMRQVLQGDDLAKLFERCQSEATLAFGQSAVYVEQYLPEVRHIEVQILGDGQGGVVHLWERDCSVQRQNQKLIEIAPSPAIPTRTRDQLLNDALTMAGSANYRGLGTFEFLVDANQPARYFFIEANARLQVEHTVTEAITGLDLVALQLKVADGATLTDLNLIEPPKAEGFAIQCRVNMETLSEKGFFKPTGGTVTQYAPPTGIGIRVDGFAYKGYQTSTRYDSLLAKVITHSRSPVFASAVAKTQRAIADFQIEGFDTNLAFVKDLLNQPEFSNSTLLTGFVDTHLSEISARLTEEETALSDKTALSEETALSAQSATGAGAAIDARDPLAVLNHRSAETTTAPEPVASGPSDSLAIGAPLQGTVVEINVAPNQEVYAGQPLLVMDAMKMEHVVSAPESGVIIQINVASGDAVFEDHAMLYLRPAAVTVTDATTETQVDLDHIRPDLAEANLRHEYGLDENRPEAVAKRRKTQHRTARENVNDLCDPDSFIEYGSLAIAAQRRRRSVQDLMEKTPGDGMVCGIGSVNGELFPDENTQCVVMSYDYMVLAGTQGLQNHRKKDRMFEVAEQLKLPIILLAEGGGGRPGDTDGAGIAGLDCLAFQLYAALSGLVPRIGITSGRCFAGNAVLLGCSDIVIATEDSNIGIGGPAMIEGGGLGIFTPDEVGPMSVQVPNGVVDIAVKDEAEAMFMAKKLLSYFQGPVSDFTCDDQRKLRAAIPENRLRVYDIHEIIDCIADTDSVLELRPKFGVGMITAFIRVAGKPMGLIANDPIHLSGAIDSDGADKAARFMQLCDAFDLPIVSLVDCPGIMVGPEIEKTALVRHASRVFVTCTSLTVPLFAIVLRKGYGLGAQAMTGGGFKAAAFTVTWPTGEFGGMGLEGAVKLGYRKELEAITDPEARRVEYEKRVAQMYDRGKAVNFATAFEIDEVIDPKDTRHWIISGMKSTPKPLPRAGKKRPFIDTW
jgi:acetyl/propionyl-CoA carboxylase alpha subunit/acetyl-CoA carboxylase carboxyltransferase component